MFPNTEEAAEALAGLRRDIAIKIMTAFIARGEHAQFTMAAGYAEIAVHYTDALLAELEK